MKLLIIPGSSRTGSVNLRLAHAAAAVALHSGATPTVLDLRALQIPLYDGDLQSSSGIPSGAFELQKQIAHSHAVLFVTPEYNHFPTPLMINALDWVSRITAKDEMPSGLTVMAGKPAGLLSASPGAFGGMKAINHLRAFLQSFLAFLVVPTQYSLPRADKAFDEKGGFVNAHDEAGVNKVIKSLLDIAGKLSQGSEKL